MAIIELMIDSFGLREIKKHREKRERKNKTEKHTEISIYRHVERERESAKETHVAHRESEREGASIFNVLVGSTLSPGIAAKNTNSSPQTHPSQNHPKISLKKLS